MSKSEGQTSDGVTPSDDPSMLRDGREAYRLTPERAEHWARKQSWTQIEARRLARNYDPTLYKQRDKLGLQDSPSYAEASVRVQPLGKRKPNLGEQMRRARRRELLHKHPTPQEFIDWLDTIVYPAPDHLRKAVLRHNKNVTDLRSEFYALLDRLGEEGLVSDAGKREILKQLDPEILSNHDTDKTELHRQEKRHLYGFVAAFAEQNGYVNDGKYANLKVLTQALGRGGLSIKSPATMRKYLDEAYSRYGAIIRNLKSSTN